jgi:hypothetical protein
MHIYQIYGWKLPGNFSSSEKWAGFSADTDRAFIMQLEIYIQYKYRKSLWGFSQNRLRTCQTKGPQKF